MSEVSEITAPPPPVIIIKKKKGHAGHHGGAWKVAYADFVTAMMALFIVLWLLNTSAEVKKAVGGYFKDPEGVGKQVGSALAGTGESLSISRDDMPKLKDKLSQAVKQSPEFKHLEKQIEMIVTGEGLRIELMETDKGVFFESGRPQPSAVGSGLIQVLAAELGKLPNRLLVEGHTDAKPFSVGTAYTNWELSADRANAARRLMEASGLRPGQVAEVRGFADQNLRKKDANDPSNRRISVIVRYQEAQQETGKPEQKAKEKEKAGAEKNAVKKSTK